MFSIWISLLHFDKSIVHSWYTIWIKIGTKTLCTWDMSILWKSIVWEIKEECWKTKTTVHWSHTKLTDTALRIAYIQKSSNTQPTAIATNPLLDMTTPCICPPDIERYMSSIIHANQFQADSSTTPICWGGGTHNHLKAPGDEPDLGTNNDLYETFSYNGQDWLDSNQILKCVLYMLHIKYSTARHRNLVGVTHPVAQLQELLTKAKQAGTNKALKVSNDIPQVMRDLLCR